MTTAWPEVALGDVAEIVMGQAPPGDSYNDNGDGVALVAGAGDFAASGLRPKKYTTAPTRVSAPGDIVLSIRATIGTKVWSDGVYCLGRGVAGLRPKPPLDRSYLWHWLSSEESALARKGRGATFLQVNRADVAEMRIPLPPIEEQMRIAAVLDKADDLRANRQSSLGLITSLTETIFVDMFGDPARNARAWPHAPLAALCSIAGEYGAAVPAAPLVDGGPRYVRITDISAEGTLSETAVGPAGDPEGWSRYRLAPGDLLFARSGATVGKTYLHGATDREHVFAGYLIRFRPDASHINPVFLYHFTRSAAYAKWVEHRQRAVAQPNINAKQYASELMVPIPPRDLQEEFASRVTAVANTRVALEGSADGLDALFVSLQQRAFAGKL